MQTRIKPFLIWLLTVLTLIAPGSGIVYAAPARHPRAAEDRNPAQLLARRPEDSRRDEVEERQHDRAPKLLLIAPSSASVYYLTGDPPVLSWQGSNLGRVRLKVKWAEPRPDRDDMRSNPDRDRSRDDREDSKPEHDDKMLPAIPTSYTLPIDLWGRITDRKTATHVTFAFKALPATRGESDLNDSEGLGETRELSGTYPIIPDTVPPVVTLTSPDPTVTRFANQTVSGTAIDNANRLYQVTLSVDGNTTTVPVSNGQFSAPYSLTEGPNTVVVSAVDRAGNVGKASFSTFLDTEPPSLSLTGPTKRITNQAQQTVTGTAADDYAPVRSIQFSLNGVASTVPVTNGQFSEPVTLMEGPNPIEIQAADAAGNVATADLPIILDTIPPTLTLASPQNGLVTNQKTQNVTGTVTDDVTTFSQIALSVNGATQSLPVVSAAYSQSVSLAEGNNSLLLTAIDEAGNVSTESAQVYVDTVPPVVSITQPANGFLASASAVPLTGTVTDDYEIGDSATVTVNGSSAAVALNASGNFNSTVDLRPGANVIVVSSADKAGNVGSSKPWTITYDSAPPVVTIETPVNNFQSASASVLVSGSIADDGPIQNTALLSVNGTVNSIPVGSDGVFSEPVTLNTGTNQIVITAYDLAGYKGISKTWTVSYQPVSSTPLTASIEGYALDAVTNAPVSGVLVTSSTGATASTNDLGKFFMETLPGTQSIHIATPVYTSADRTVAPLAGETVDVVTAYLTQLDTKSTVIQPSTGGTVVNSAQNAQLIVPAGAIAAVASISVTVVSTATDDSTLPAPLPAGAVPVSFADLQPSGLQFSQFATLRLPNWKNYPPGTPVPCSYWDEKNQVWAGVGGGAVTSDGKYLEIPVNHFSFYGFFNPPPSPPVPPGPPPITNSSEGSAAAGAGAVGPGPENTGPGNDGEETGSSSSGGGGGGSPGGRGGCLGSNVDVLTGNHNLDYRMQGLPSFGLPTAPILTYNSKNRTRMLPLRFHFSDPTNVAGTAPTVVISWTLTVAGRTFAGTGPDVQVNWDTRDASRQYVEPGRYQITLNSTDVTTDTRVRVSNPT
ncbi:MAG: hypothetical protein KGR26_02165, partial [Cyanobacteria bacterium REEB65]|nr:hypothetical protein [Cyanobacteria bacterium REEB65]